MSLAAGVGRGRRSDRLFALLAVVAFATLLWMARDATFRGDEWDFIANRSLLDPVGLMRPFNEQWVAVPAAVFRALFAVVGMHTYLPYLVTLLTLHLLVALTVRRLAEAAAGELAGVAAGTVVLFLGTGNENLGQAFQIGMVLAAGCGLAAMDALILRARPRAAAGLLLIAAASHAVAAAFLGACIVAAVVRFRQSPRDLRWTLVPAAALAGWFVAFDLPSVAARGGAFVQALISVPAFVVSGIATATGAIFGLSMVAGAAILIALGFLGVVGRRRPRRGRLAVAATAALVLEYGLIAISRAEFGLESVLWSRYVYVAVPLVIVAITAFLGSWAVDADSGRRGTHDTRDARDSRANRLAFVLTALTVVAVIGNLRFYSEARDLTLDFVHRTRAAVAVAEWATDLTTWDQELHLPAPGRLRELLAAHGSPARDTLLPAVVPAVPSTIAIETCRQLVPNPARLDGCVAAVAALVGGR